MSIRGSCAVQWSGVPCQGTQSSHGSRLISLLCRAHLFCSVSISTIHVPRVLPTMAARKARHRSKFRIRLARAALRSSWEKRVKWDVLGSTDLIRMMRAYESSSFADKLIVRTRLDRGG